MDLFPSQDLYEGFCSYQAALLEEFDRLAEEYRFEIVDASADADAVCDLLKDKILAIVEPAHAESPAVKLSETLVRSLADRIMAKLMIDPPRKPSTKEPSHDAPSLAPANVRFPRVRGNGFRSQA